MIPELEAVKLEASLEYKEFLSQKKNFFFHHSFLKADPHLSSSFKLG